jgi:CubicO group peptidase (beta-lactamase class C family)
MSIENAPLATPYEVPAPVAAALAGRQARGDFFDLQPPVLKAGLSGPVQELLSQHEDLCRKTGADACLAACRGELISEQYWHGFSRSTPTYMMSSTKSVASLLFGILRDDGLLKLDDRVGDFVAGWDNGPAAQVTLEHLLTHRAGLAQRPVIRGWGCSIGWEEDAHQSAMRCRPATPPGSGRALYSNEGVQLLGVVMDECLRRQQTSLQDYARARLFEPLGLAPETQFREQPAGKARVFGDMIIRPRDFMVFGMLMLNHGVWEGQRVVSDEWIALSTSPKNEVWWNEKAYQTAGYLWWPIENPRGFASRGYLHTDMYVFPGEELVVLRSQRHHTLSYAAYQPQALTIFDKLAEQLRRG